MLQTHAIAQRGEPVTIQGWGAIGEVVGAVAVVATLAYLATQIRYARLAASDTSRENRAQGVRDMMITTINNPAFRDAWRKADTGSSSPMAEAWEYDPLTKALLEPDFVTWVDEVLARAANR